MSDEYTKVRRYNAHPSGLECIEVVERLDFCAGSAIKYLWRAGLKDDVESEHRKALYYVLRDLSRPNLTPSLDALSRKHTIKLQQHMAHGNTAIIRNILVAHCTGSAPHLQRAATWIQWLLDNPGKPLRYDNFKAQDYDQAT